MHSKVLLLLYKPILINLKTFKMEVFGKKICWKRANKRGQVKSSFFMTYI